MFSQKNDKSKISFRKSLIWDYFTEIFAAFLITSLLLLIFGRKSLSEFFIKSSIAWTTLAVGMLAADLSMFWQYLNIVDGDFWLWLKIEHKHGKLRAPFILTIGIQFLTIIFFILMLYVTSKLLAQIGLLLLIYSALLFFTSLMNMSKIHELKQEFNDACANHKFFR